MPNEKPPTLADIPGDAPMDDDITLGCWNGKRFVDWKTWRAQTPIGTIDDDEDQTLG